MDKQPISILEANTIELHYWFDDNSHYMNAMAFNKCEHEALCIIYELANKLKIDIEVVTEPLENGGLRSWFRIDSSDSDTAKTIKKAFLTAMFAQVMVTPITTALAELTKKGIEYVFESAEIRQLKEKKEKLQLELDIDKLQEELNNRAKKVDENLIKKKKSNFYNSLEQCSKVTDISFSSANKEKEIIQEKKVPRKDFKNHILLTDELDPIIYEGAEIEIVSPVLKRGKYKWVGIYQGEVIHFNMRSVQFTTQVILGEVNFKNGFVISCTLIAKRKVNPEGVVVVTGYEVPYVESYTENNIPTETLEAKKKRQRKEDNERQGRLF